MVFLKNNLYFSDQECQVATVVGEEPELDEEHVYKPGMANNMPVGSRPNSVWISEEEYIEEYSAPVAKEYTEIETATSQQNNLE